MPQDEPVTTDRDAWARLAALLAATGLPAYFACIWLSQPWLGLPAATVFPGFVVMVAGNLLLAATAHQWAGMRYAGAAYGIVHGIFITIVLHQLGGLGAVFLVFVQLFPIFHAAMLGSTAEVFLTANVSGACLAGMAIGETTGLLAPPGPLAPPLTVPQAAAMAGFAWVGFNFFALYASSYSAELRGSALRLRDQVVARTAELRVANAELHAKARALEAAQEELRTFLYTVTHDLKSPVNSILLVADLARELPEVLGVPRVRAEIERIVRLAGRTEDMIRDLFEFFQVTTMNDHSGPFELGPLVAETLETLHPQVVARGVVVECPTSLPRVWGHGRMIGRVIDNLLRNAVQHARRSHGRVVVQAERTGDELHLAVSDDGPGIAPRYHAAIFELFGRVPRDAGNGDPEGSGVGLAIVRRIVEAHGGRVWVESEEGNGATFHVTLPQPPVAAAPGNGG